MPESKYPLVRRFFTVLFSAVIPLVQLASTATTPTFAASGKTTETAIADIYIHKQNPTSNYGNSQLLTTHRFMPYAADKLALHKLILIRFDLSSTIYTGKNINKIELKFMTSTKGDTHKSVRILPDSGWSENSANYNTFVVPGLAPALSFYEYPIVYGFRPIAGSSVMDSSGNVTLNLTSDIKPLVGKKFVIAIEDQGKKDFSIYSKENTSGKPKPRLEVSYSDTSTPATPAGSLQQLTSSQIPLSNKDVTAPLRGLYKWRGSTYNPNFTPIYDVYERFNWKDLEGSKDSYNFSKIDSKLNSLTEGQKFGMRIRAMENLGNTMPSYMQTDQYSKICDGQRIPNWDAPAFLERAQALMTALSNKYNKAGVHTKFSFIDIGIYGKYGEWHLHGMNTSCQASSTTQKKLIDMQVQAFSNIQLLMMYNTPQAKYLLSQIHSNDFGPIGLRSDTIGDNVLTFNSNITSDSEQFLASYDRWKIAPFVTEFAGESRMNKTTAFETGKMEVTAWHISALGNGNSHKWDSYDTTTKAEFDLLGKTLGYRFVPQKLMFYGLGRGKQFTLDYSFSNLGVAPSYEPWQVKLRLTRSNDANKKVEFNLGANLRTLMPTLSRITGVDSPQHFREAFTFPSSLPAGTYKVELVAVDTRASNQRKPLQFAINGRQSSGYYNLGTVTVN